jgi:altronate hydrolase
VQRTTLQLDPRDNVVIALSDLASGSTVEASGKKYLLVTDVPAKQKFAAQEFCVGDPVVMYGVLTGKAVVPIRAGEILTTRNMRHEAAPYHAATSKIKWRAPDVSKWKNATFKGYVRADGQVGTRNYWIVIPLVFCENRNLAVMKQAFEEELGFAAPQIYRQQVAELARKYRDRDLDAIRVAPNAAGIGAGHAEASRLFPNIDGIKFLTHEMGCGGTLEDSRNLCSLLAGYAHHPNVAGATVLSLGCQHAEVSMLREEIARRDPDFKKPLLIFDQQKSGTEFELMSDAIRQTFLGLAEANRAQRKAVPLRSLCIGLKCGGSDGFSGITANPAVGYVSDMIAALGGRTILSEFPELCGVEQNLIDRATTPEVAEKFMRLMTEYSNRARAVLATFAMNPSPGNIRDGLITDAMKSAGAAKKGGTSPVTGVLEYAEYCAEPGLKLQCTPGSDVECVSAQVGAGANVVLFTTGLGTPTGNAIAPVVKISTNTPLARRMPDIIDADAGSIVAGDATISGVGEELLATIVKVASGEMQTKAELLHQDDFIPWKRGVSL